MSNVPENGPMAEELDLQQWADELGKPYELGTQGNFMQPPQEVGTPRLEAFLGRIAKARRELSDLPAVVSSQEQKLHVTTKVLKAMTPEEREQWENKALEWVLLHPGSTIDSLIDIDISDRP